MGFLSGRISFERFRIGGSQPPQFDAEHLETLEQFAIGRYDTSSLDQPNIGFLAGSHLFDGNFTFEKNIIVDALHCGLRIDTNVIPSAIRKAWLQMELAALTVDNESGRPTKAQKQQAKEAVEARCEEEARTGKFRRMQQFPVLWDSREGYLYFGGSSPSASEHCTSLFERAFELELERVTAGKLAQWWADETKQREALEDVSPAVFHASEDSTDIAWWGGQSGNYDFLGNEFLLWLWWFLETQSDTLELPDDSEVTVMLARTLSLECPRGESGKETISAECPVRLPEAVQAIRSGKLPRKAGLTLVRLGMQYDLVLQAESFAVGGARVQADDPDEEGRGVLEARVDSVRQLRETLDLLFGAFCTRRLGKSWSGELDQIRRWLKPDAGAKRKPAA